MKIGHGTSGILIAILSCQYFKRDYFRGNVEMLYIRVNKFTYIHL